MKSKTKKQTFAQSFKNAFLGIRYSLQGRNFIIQIIIGAAAIVFAYYLKLPSIEKIIVILLVGLVLGGEMFNSAFEHILDLIEKEHNIYVAKAKDIAAAAVLTFSLTALVIGLWIFGKLLL